MSEEEAKLRELEEIREEVERCKRCGLHKTARNKVFGEGGFKKKVLIVGEAPGREEDEKGRPFVGKAGKFLDSCLKEVGIGREDVFITNVLKCRPPNNRDPKEEEIKACSPFLKRQIEALRPKVILCLGRFSAKWIFEYFGIKFGKISEVRGKVFKAKANWGEVLILPTYHPALDSTLCYELPSLPEY
jgi:DNA polymerase